MSTSPDQVVLPAFAPGATTPSAGHQAAVARAAGYAAGWSAGARAARTQVEREGLEQARRLEADAAAHRDALHLATRALEQAAATLRSTSVPAVEQVADTVVDAALELAAAVLGHEPVAATTPGRDALRRALAGRPDEQAVTVRLAPADAAEVAGALPDGVTVVPDPGLTRGDSVLEHDLGRVEVLLQAGLRRAREVLLP
ncbi:FliH/SctL family protein [Thalassiella azotivora]